MTSALEELDCTVQTHRAGRPSVTPNDRFATERPANSAPSRAFTRQVFPLAAACLLLATLYFALEARAGIISTNDGSHYALVQALATDRTARIDRYVYLTAVRPPTGTPTARDLRDVSYYDGHFYSDRPPGTAVLAVPFYWLGQLAGTISGRRDLDFPLLFTMMLPPALGAVTALATFGLCRALGTGAGAAAVTMTIAATGTLLLKYATLLYSHVAAAAFVTIGMAFLAGVTNAARFARGWVLVVAGLALGYSAVVEYPNLLLVAPVALFLLWLVSRRELRRAEPIGFVAGWALPVAALLIYNWMVFGRPWRTTYAYQYYFVWARDVRTTYVTPLATGLRWLLVGPSGLLAITPLLALALWGALLLIRRRGIDRARALLLFGAVLVVLIPTALHRTYYGGGSQDTRYLVTIVPLVVAPLAVWCEWLAGRQRIARWAGAAVLAAGGIWGFLRSYLSLMSMFGRPASELPAGRAWTILRRQWADPWFLAPNLALAHYLLVWLVPATLVLAGGVLAWTRLLRHDRLRRAFASSLDPSQETP